MQLTYLAHASLLIESRGIRLVTDPWLDGPTYLGAWWQFPEPALGAGELGHLDYVYLTHEHIDHFHEPTLRSIPRTTPILIGKYTSPRFRSRLQALGFIVHELPHAETAVLKGGLKLTSYQYRADDTALMIEDESATVFDLNDCLLHGSSLDQVLDHHPRVDLVAASFANAEAYPIVYELDDPTERPDWDDDALFDGFLSRVRRIAPQSFVPFASMFCFLSDDLFPLNARIASPTRLMERARAGEVKAAALGMNPGDTWTPERGHESRRPVDWAEKPRLLQDYRRRYAAQIAEVAAAERVPGGDEAVRSAFRQFFTGWAERLPWVVRRRLDLRVRFDVEGQTLWLNCGTGRVDFGAPASDDAFDVLVRLSSWPLWRACTKADTWQSLCVSCRLQVRLRPGVREREVLFWFFLYLDDMGWLEARSFLTPRALGVLFDRRRELAEYAQFFLSGSFVRRGLREKIPI